MLSDRYTLTLLDEEKNYETGLRMRFAVNDIAACADLLRRGRIGDGVSGILDFFRVPEALRDPGDRKAFRKYIRSYLSRQK